MTSVTLDDIEVFVLTYKRPEQLRITLRNLLSETIIGKDVAVLDNGAMPETRNVVDSFSDDSVRYYDSSALGCYGNVQMAPKVASKKYFMMLHDDDMIRSNYLQKACCVLSQYPDASLFTGYTSPWPIKQERKKLPPLKNNGYIFSGKEFATFLYNHGGPSYSLAIYRTDAYRKVDVHSTMSSCGKWGDAQLMIEAVGDGKAIVSKDICGWMGVHPGQDIYMPENMPPYQCWLDREKMFLKYMGDDPLTFPGLSFCLLNYRHLKIGFKKRIKAGITFHEYIQKAKMQGAMTTKSQLFRWISVRLFQKLFLKLARALYYNRRITKLC